MTTDRGSPGGPATALTGRPDAPRIVASGALWMVVYNLVWGAAWFGFMRSEWERAYADLGRQSTPWTAEVWFVWVVLTFPIGVAVLAHAATSGRSVPGAATFAAVPIWLLMAGGMAGYGWQEGLSSRVIALDSGVNLVGLMLASVAGGWSARTPTGRGRTASDDGAGHRARPG